MLAFRREQLEAIARRRGARLRDQRVRATLPDDGEVGA